MKQITDHELHIPYALLALLLLLFLFAAACGPPPTPPATIAPTFTATEPVDHDLFLRATVVTRLATEPALLYEATLTPTPTITPTALSPEVRLLPKAP